MHARCIPGMANDESRDNCSLSCALFKCAHALHFTVSSRMHALDETRYGNSLTNRSYFLSCTSP